MKTFLIHNKGYTWKEENGIFVKGYVIDGDNIIEGNELVKYFGKVNDDDFIGKVRQINGLFSVIIKKENKIFLYSDKSRFFPIFYFKTSDEIFISDEPFKFLKYIKNPSIDKLASYSFLGSGFVIGNKTLIKDIYQVQAGEYLIFENNILIKSGNAFSYQTNPESLNKKGYKELKEDCYVKIEESFNRLIKYLNGRTAVIPLSGGFDSRLIATALKKRGYNNVVCFTYGKKDNPEVKISQKVAKNLGYKWHFIEYTPEIIDGFMHSEVFLDYYKYASRMVSMFYMQEYFATKYLSENLLLDKTAIFLPGHSGDLLGGSQLLKIIPEKIPLAKIAPDIFNKKFNLNVLNADRRRSLIKLINEQLTGSRLGESKPYSLYEEWDIKEKIAKFNINSSQVFSFFGYKVFFPFWDSELVNFFKDLPYEYKKYKRLYDEVLTERYFIPMNVSFSDETNPSAYSIRKQIIKDKIKEIFPHSINLMFSNIPDEFNYKLITSYLVDDALNKGKKINTKVKYYNSVIVQWYLYKLENVIKRVDEKD